MTKKPLSAVNIFAVSLGIFLVVIGFAGLFDPLVFGIFSSNFLHAFIHLVLGVTGIYTGLRNHARKFSLYVGILLLVVGVAYFIPNLGELVVKAFNVNHAVAVLNIVLGIAAILFAMLTPKPAIPGVHVR